MPRQKNIATHRPGSLSEFMSKAATLMDQSPNDDQAGVMLWRGQSSVQWALEPSLQVMWKNNPSGLLDAEQKMYREFSQAAPFLMPSQIDSDWDRLSIAQHYGMATRLLDWTVNPLMALWFALSASEKDDAAVWFYRPLRNNMTTNVVRSKSPFEIKYTKVFRPVTHSSRVAMQAGWHTVHKFEEGKGLRAIDEMSTHARCLAIFIIRESLREDIFRQLENTGMSSSNVFGDLASLCSLITRRYRYTEDKRIKILPKKSS
jgi:hypothetical protein